MLSEGHDGLVGDVGVVDAEDAVLAATHDQGECVTVTGTKSSQPTPTNKQDIFLRNV